jgi:hypothetical protein
MVEENKKWKLSLGCHRGTITSRDSGIEEYDSLEACKQAVAEAEKFWTQTGTFVWFATAFGPNGEEIKLHPGTPYKS